MTAHKETVAKETATKETATKDKAIEATSWSQDVSWVIAANSPGYNSVTLAANVMDGDFDTIWNSGGNDSCRTHCNNWWIEFDIGSEQTMSGMHTRSESRNQRLCNSFMILEVGVAIGATM